MCYKTGQTYLLPTAKIEDLCGMIRGLRIIQGRPIRRSRCRKLRARTIEPANTLKAIRPRELRVFGINTTVQAKIITHPTDRHLLEVARSKLADRAQAAEADIKLRQSYARTGPRLNCQAGRYAQVGDLLNDTRPSHRIRTQDQWII